MAVSRARTPAPPPSLTETLKGFVGRRAIEALGAALVAAGLFLLLALGSYSPADPSWSHAPMGGGGQRVLNLLGRPGAAVADLLLQTVGLAAIIPAVLFAGWGWRLIRDHALPRWWIRLTLLPPIMALAGIALSIVPPPADWPAPLDSGLGGVIGKLVLGSALSLAGHGIAGGTLGAIAAIIGALLFVFALSVTRGEWRATLGAGAWAGGHALALLRRAAAWRPRPADPASTRARAKEAARRVEPGLAAAPDPDDAEDEEIAPPQAEAPRAPPAIERNRVAPAALVEKTGGDAGAAKKAKPARQTKLDLPPGGDPYRRPPLDLLAQPSPAARGQQLDENALAQNARLLESVLEDFGVKGQIVKVRPGPVVTLYELEPAPGTKSSRVIGLADDIARSMSALSVRVAVIPGRNVIGIELPNVHRETVYLRELLETDAADRNPGALTLMLGKDIGGGAILVDLARMPHLLIAGTTGSGKSVAINTMILSLLFRLSPDECRFIMIDPKMLELSVYDGIPHLLSPVVTEPKKAVVALKWAVREMENRYRAMSKLGVRNIAGYNQRLSEARRKGEVLLRKVQTGFDEDGKPVFEEQPLDLKSLPFIVVVVDEMADLMLVAGKDIEWAVQRLAQMARAAGIHLIMATQRPSVDVITGTIKANFPTRISFQVTSRIDSRTILGDTGAEQLLGQGDMLYMAGGGRILRVHGPFCSDQEVETVVSMLKEQGSPDYADDVTEEVDEMPGLGAPGGGGGEDGSGDQLYDQAVALVTRERKCTTSFIQRHLQIGYNRAARIVERMESEGVVGSANHVGKREVLAPKGDYNE